MDMEIDQRQKDVCPPGQTGQSRKDGHILVAHGESPRAVSITLQPTSGGARFNRASNILQRGNIFMPAAEITAALTGPVESRRRCRRRAGDKRRHCAGTGAVMRLLRLIAASVLYSGGRWCVILGRELPDTGPSPDAWAGKQRVSRCFKIQKPASLALIGLLKAEGCTEFS